MYGPLEYLCAMFVVYRDPKTAVAIQKMIFVLLCGYRGKTKEMDNGQIQIGVNFIAK
jgi:hypothetical protein